jgi:hypothetical protein
MVKQTQKKQEFSVSQPASQPPNQQYSRNKKNKKKEQD